MRWGLSVSLELLFCIFRFSAIQFEKQEKIILKVLSKGLISVDNLVEAAFEFFGSGSPNLQNKAKLVRSESLK